MGCTVEAVGADLAARAAELNQRMGWADGGYREPGFDYDGLIEYRVGAFWAEGGKLYRVVNDGGARAEVTSSHERRVGRMTCCCCGECIPGVWPQWSNRDTGYSVCAACVRWQLGRGTPAAEIADLYGVAGVHYAAEVAE